jgi:hypothetical protein
LIRAIVARLVGADEENGITSRVKNVKHAKRPTAALDAQLTESMRRKLGKGPMG